MRIWAVANQKGGVGKTTTVATIAGLLSDRGKRVLVIDLDPHGSLTSYFGHDPDRLAVSTFNLFAENQQFDRQKILSMLLPTGVDTISLFPASPVLATVERRAISQDGMGLRVSRAMAQVWDDFDYALIDTPPILGALLINAVAAADKLLIPCQTEFLAIKGLERMLRTLTMVTRSLRKDLPYLIIPTMFDRRTQASVSSLVHMRHTYVDKIWASMIPVDTRFRDASRLGKVISHYDANSRGAQAYTSLLKTLLSEQERRLRA